MMGVLALLGPTAAGKSGLALDIARDRGDVEIVAVDAFTIYRGMDIGTAKPTAAARAAVVHHLVDEVEPDTELTVAQFQQRARGAIDGVCCRGRTPLLVGGSGLYWRAVVDDLRFPPTDAEARARLEAFWEHDPPAAHAHLSEVDPAAAARIDAANLRRTVRALEVIELTGQRFSSFATAWERHASIYPDLDVACLEPAPEPLRARIEQRAEAMVAGGLLTEARRLRQRYGRLSRTAAQAIGYAEAYAVLDGEADEGDLATAIAMRTWRYAKRQRSWFRTDERCVPSEPAEIRRRWAERRRPSEAKGEAGGLGNRS